MLSGDVTDVTDEESACGKALLGALVDYNCDVATAGRQQVGEVSAGGTGAHDQDPYCVGRRKETSMPRNSSSAATLSSRPSPTRVTSSIPRLPNAVLG